MIQQQGEVEVEGEDREAVDQWDLGEEVDDEEEEESQYHDDKDARQLQETILIELKVSKGREEKRPRFVQFMCLEIAMNFHSLYNPMHVAKYSQLELIDCF